ncbi:MAG: class I SAM-dependent methyltransferase [Halofilum sp. (in: g-proteobacteria)]
MYRLQRFIYDPTRRWYLLGRDELIAHLDVPADGSVLELACGTGRNLVRIGERAPGAALYGLELSREMLKSARANCRRAGMVQRTTLAVGDASTFDAAVVFGCRGQFDRIVISYALSMIPAWHAVVDRGIELLTPNGSLHIVDFGDGGGLPDRANRVLRGWLGWFHVEPRSEAPAYLRQRGRAVQARMEVHWIARGYAWRAALYRGACNP